MRRILPITLLLICSTAFADPPDVHPRPQRPSSREQIIRMKIVDSVPEDPGRVFSVPVVCNEQEADFELSCTGTSRLSESFAKKCAAEVLPDEQLARVLDPDGNPEYAGSTTVLLRFGGREQRLHVPVMKDQYCQTPEKQGVLGCDAIRAFQWEVDPSAPSLTLRPLGTYPARKPLAIIPLRVTPDGYFANVKVRNVRTSVALLPGGSYVQAGPKLQHQWDLNSGKPLELDVKRFSSVRLYHFKGEDAVELAKDIRETDLTVALVGDPKHPDPAMVIDSGIGQCVLNRFVYCVDGSRGQLRIMSRVPAPTPRPTNATPAKPASHAQPATRPAGEGYQ